jgi:hypothetical protein
MLCPRYLTAAIMTCPPELLWSCDSSSTSGSGTVLGLTYLILTLLPYSYSHPHSSSFGSLLILPTSNLQPLTLQPPTSYLLPLTSYLLPPTSNLQPPTSSPFTSTRLQQPTRSLYITYQLSVLLSTYPIFHFNTPEKVDVLNLLGELLPLLPSFRNLYL